MKLPDIKKFQPVSIDTRTLQPGDLFIALKGSNFDGHDFVTLAEQKGAIAAVVERKVNCNIPLIEVDSTFHELGKLAHLRRQEIDIPIIGVTGSCGKTTTKTMLASVLEQYGKTLATEKTLNNTIGVPLTLLRLEPCHKFAVIEIGANQPNEIDYSAGIVNPNVAIIANVAPVHLQGFGGLDDVARNKGDILKHLTNKGSAVLNADDDYFQYFEKSLKAKFIVSFGINNPADISASEIVVNENGTTRFILHTPLGIASVTLPVLGVHNVMNALAAAGAAYAVGAPLTAIKNGLEDFQPVIGRLIKKSGYNGAVILDDSFNANPESIRAAMAVLAKITSRENALVIGDMAELGSMEESYHHQLGIWARDFGVQKLYAVGQLTRITVSAFGKGGYFFFNRDELIAELKNILHSDMTVLVKGSKINHMWEIVDILVNK